MLRTKMHINSTVFSCYSRRLQSSLDDESHNLLRISKKLRIKIQGEQKVSVHLMTTIQKVTSNVQSVPRQSPDIHLHTELCSRRPCSA